MSQPTIPPRHMLSKLSKLKAGRPLKRAVVLSWQAGRKWFVVAIILSVLISVVPLLALYLQKLFFDLVAEGLVDGAGLSTRTLLWLVIAMASVAIVNSLISAFTNYASTAQGQVVQDHVMNRLHSKSIDVDLSYYETPSYFDSLHVAQTEAPERASTFVNTVTAVFRDSLTLVAVLILLVSLHWGVTLLLFLAVGPGLWVQVKSSGKLFRWRQRAANRQREANYYHELLTQAGPAKESRVFGFGGVIADWYKVLRLKLRSELLTIEYWKQTRTFVVGAFGAIAVFTGIFIFARQTAGGEYTIGDLAMFYAGFLRCQGSLRSLIGGISKLYESSLFFGNLFDFLDTEAKVVNSDSAVSIDSSARHTIEFKDVAFSYPGSARSAVKGISLAVRPGEHIAIVGKNGSGKSTFVKLLCRLYDRTSGEVLLDGIDVKEYKLNEYRKLYSVLFQDYLQFSLSAEKNIWLSRVDGGKEGVSDAAKLSGADEVVQRLPRGYETPLGKVLEEGEQLSQGEWQKLALARALHADAEITILDEPTSWMDPESEQAFFERFHSMAEGRTAIMISHRLSTVKMVDRIIVMEQGRIVEMGTHDELISRRGRYFELFELQAESYR